MFIDLNGVRPQRFTGDVCVVGTGAAGLTLASVLLTSGLSVLMLESGGFDAEASTSELNVCDAGPLLFEGAVRGRRRAFGGSTMCWGGQLLPLEPLDFVKRPWVANSGWPIDLHDLRPYYQQALRFAGVDGSNFDSDVFEALGRTAPFDPAGLRHFFSKWSPRPQFRDHLVDDLRASATLRVFLHANVTALTLGRRRQIESVRAQNQGYWSFTFSAPAVVLCTGGIETARLLLSNCEANGYALGNRSGHVGRYFQDHPSILVGTLKSDNPAAVREVFRDGHVQGNRVSPRLALSPEIQEREALLNASANVSVGYPPILLRRAMGLNLLRQGRRHPGGWLDLVRLSATSLGPTLALRRAGRQLEEHERFVVSVVTEQEPDPNSLITLSGRCDAFGVPRARISWNPTRKTWDTVLGFSRELQKQFSDVGLGNLTISPLVREQRRWRAFPHDMYHHMGSTRMSASPSIGVVDENCRVHGVENLYIASASVFPTGGHSNCTLTIMALTLRLADHLGLAR